MDGVAPIIILDLIGLSWTVTIHQDLLNSHCGSEQPVSHTEFYHMTLDQDKPIDSDCEIHYYNHDTNYDVCVKVTEFRLPYGLVLSIKNPFQTRYYNCRTGGPLHMSCGKKIWIRLLSNYPSNSTARLEIEIRPSLKRVATIKTTTIGENFEKPESPTLILIIIGTSVIVVMITVIVTICIITNTQTKQRQQRRQQRGEAGIPLNIASSYHPPSRYTAIPNEYIDLNGVSRQSHSLQNQIQSDAISPTNPGSLQSNMNDSDNTTANDRQADHVIRPTEMEQRETTPNHAINSISECLNVSDNHITASTGYNAVSSTNNEERNESSHVTGRNFGRNREYVNVTSETAEYQNVLPNGRHLRQNGTPDPNPAERYQTLWS